MHTREKKSSPTHQNTDTSFPNQETLISHPYNPTHSEGHPERFTELHGEEKREEGDRGDQDEMRWNQERREQASQ